MLKVHFFVFVIVFTELLIKKRVLVKPLYEEVMGSRKTLHCVNVYQCNDIALQLHMPFIFLLFSFPFS